MILRSHNAKKAGRGVRRITAAVEAIEPRVLLNAFIVNTFADQIDPPASSTLSVRDAIAMAAANPGPDTVTLAKGTYRLTLGELLINDTSGTLTLNAAAGGASINANGKSRVLEVAADTTVIANGLTLTNGSASGNGGGILNSGSLTLSASVVSSNKSTGPGGGINNVGTLALSTSTVTGNTAEGFANGGGVANYGTFNATADTFSFNHSTNFGTEISNGIGQKPTLTLIDSTLFDTVPGADGLDNVYETDVATVADCTLVGNGINNRNSGSLTLANTLIANNLSGNPTPSNDPPDYEGSVISQGGNFIGAAQDPTVFAATDQVGSTTAAIDPKLSTLGNFGGPTQTVVPLATSPLLGKGVVSAIPAGITTDQRGLARVVGGKLDIGAVQTSDTSVIAITPPKTQKFAAGGISTVSLGSIAGPIGQTPFTVDVHWGDGTPDTMFVQSNAGPLTPQAHRFARSGTLSGSICATDAAGDLSNLAKFTALVVVQPTVSMVVNTPADVIDHSGSKTVSLRDAISRANQAGGPVNITFDPTVFARPQTIVLSKGSLEFSNPFGLESIVGPAATLSIEGPGTNLIVDAETVALVAKVTVAGEQTPSGLVYSTGIENNGNLTITNSVISDHDSRGIDNPGTLTLRNSTVSGNSVAGEGGGLYNFGSATVSYCTFTGNSTVGQYRGAQSPGGAIYNGGKLVLTNSTLSGNSSYLGGSAIENQDGGPYNGYRSGTAVVRDCTISNNLAAYPGANAIDGGASLTLVNSIVAGNQALSQPADISGAITSLGHNLIGNASSSTGWIASDLTGTASSPLDPKLAPLGNYGGPTQTQTLLQGSPAIDAGSASLIPAGDTTDQRGFPRVVGGKVDIGAVQLQHSSVLAVTPPPLQHVFGGVRIAISLGSFTDTGNSGPYTLDVNWGDGSPNAYYPVNSAGSLGLRTHTFLNTGNLTGTELVINRFGDISNIATFTIVAKTEPLTVVVVNTTRDQVDPVGSRTVSLRDAVNAANASIGPVTITFDPAVFAMAQTVSLIAPGFDITNRFGQVTITGPTTEVTVRGTGSPDDIYVSSLAKVFISNVTLSGAESGIINAGMLTLTHSTISGNVQTSYNPYGSGGIGNTGIATVIDCVIKDNYDPPAQARYGPNGSGGGVDNSGTLTLSGCMITDNSADIGGGIYNAGVLSILNSIVSGNTARDGGGIYNNGGTGSGSLTVTDCTFSNNSAITADGSSTSQGGGIYTYFATVNITGSTISSNTNGGIFSASVGLFSSLDPVVSVVNSTIANNTGAGVFVGDVMVLDNCTISANTSTNVGAGVLNAGIATVANSVVAGNTGTAAGAMAPDVSGAFTSLGHNLIGKTNGSSGWVSSDLTGTNAHPLNAMLLPLGNYGGPTQTLEPMADSPVLGAGSVALVPVGVITDQRGFARVIGGKVDIGSVESPSTSVVTIIAPAPQPVTAGISATISLGTLSDPGSVVPFVASMIWGDDSTDSSYPLSNSGRFWNCEPGVYQNRFLFSGLWHAFSHSAGLNLESHGRTAANIR